jgi:hypothetical protein
MSEEDFKDNGSDFLSTNENVATHIFDVDNSSIVGVGSELMVDVDATKTPPRSLVAESNLVEVVPELEGLRRLGVGALDFDIQLTRTGPDTIPEYVNYMAGEDIITANVEVTQGSIGAAPTVTSVPLGTAPPADSSITARWYLTADHWRTRTQSERRPNIWNGGDPPLTGG